MEFDEYQTYMRKRLKYWAKKLGLHQFTIILNLDVADEKVSAQGCVVVDSVGRNARIDIVDREWYRKEEFIVAQDPEVTLVHELLHIVYHQLESTHLLQGTLAFELHHQILSRQAQLLVSLSRGFRDAKVD
jgi:hypothetical protein